MPFNVESLRPLIESALRYVLAVLVGYLGIPVAEGHFNTTVGVLAAIAVGGISLAWSKASDKKVVEKATVEKAVNP